MQTRCVFITFPPLRRILHVCFPLVRYPPLDRGRLREPDLRRGQVAAPQLRRRRKGEELAAPVDAVPDHVVLERRQGVAGLADDASGLSRCKSVPARTNRIRQCRGWEGQTYDVAGIGALVEVVQRVLGARVVDLDVGALRFGERPGGELRDGAELVLGDVGVAEDWLGVGAVVEGEELDVCWRVFADVCHGVVVPDEDLFAGGVAFWVCHLVREVDLFVAEEFAASGDDLDGAEAWGDLSVAAQDVGIGVCGRCY